MLSPLKYAQKMSFIDVLFLAAKATALYKHYLFFLSPGSIQLEIKVSSATSASSLRAPPTPSSLCSVSQNA